MNKIYLVKAYGGEYDDAWEDNLFACTTQEAAELAIIELQERDARIKIVLPTLHQQFIELRKFMPLEQEMAPPWPKGPAKQTKENRDAHQRQIAEYQRIVLPMNARNTAKQHAWTDKVTELQRAEAQRLGLSDADTAIIDFPVYRAHADTSNYMFEELELR